MDFQREKMESLQYINNLLLKEEETRELKIIKMEEELNKISILLEETMVAKE